MANFKMKGNDLCDSHGHKHASLRGNDVCDANGHKVGAFRGTDILQVVLRAQGAWVLRPGSYDRATEAVIADGEGAPRSPASRGSAAARRTAPAGRRFHRGALR